MQTSNQMADTEIVVNTSTASSSLSSSSSSGVSMPIVYTFGRDQNKPVSEVTLQELLLLAIDYKLLFQPVQQGKKTVQNFRCYSSPLHTVTAKQDDQRVRDVLTLLYAELDDNSRAILEAAKPSVEVIGGIADWNARRKTTALEAQERIINTISANELDIATKLNITVPKRVANTTTAVMGRIDVLKLNVLKYDNKRQGGLMNSWIKKSAVPASASSQEMDETEIDG